jgi:hypothetical protein
MVRKILLAWSLLLVSAVSYAAQPVAGTYEVHGKSAKLNYAYAKKGTFLDKPVTVLVLSEKEPAKAGDFNVDGGDLGDAIELTLSEQDGAFEIENSVFHHAAFPGASGRFLVSAEEMQAANGEISGHLVSGTFADAVQMKVDLRFHARQP